MSSNFPRSPFWSARKALWGDDVRWLLVRVARICSGHLFVNKLRIVILKRSPLSRISLYLNILPLSKERKNRLIQGRKKSLLLILRDLKVAGRTCLGVNVFSLNTTLKSKAMRHFAANLPRAWESSNNLTSSPQRALRADQNSDRGKFELVLKAFLEPKRKI